MALYTNRVYQDIVQRKMLIFILGCRSEINPPDCAGFLFVCAAQSAMHIEICVADCNKAEGLKDNQGGRFISDRHP